MTTVSFIKGRALDRERCVRAPAFSATRAINKRRHLSLFYDCAEHGRAHGRWTTAESGWLVGAVCVCVCVRQGLIKSCSESGEENMEFARRRTPRRALAAGNNCLYDKLLLCY